MPIVHSLNDLDKEDDQDEGRMAMGVGDMPVDGEQLPVDFHGLYHEKQIGALCAVHALNNLVQARRFDEVELASVAHELDEAEAGWLEGSKLAGEESSANVRADGFFSVQVVLAALQRAGLSCSATMSPRPEAESGFILNRREHWFALRRIGNEWFDLNSMFAKPTWMSTVDLAAFIKAQADQGYSVFVVRGTFPPSKLDRDASGLARAVQACRDPWEGSLPRASSSEASRPPTFDAFSGSGQRLSAPQIDPSLQAAMQDDPELAAAVAASVADGSQSKDAKDDAAEIRRKRLARFGG